MRHTTNFFTFLVLFIVSIMFLTLPVSAAVDVIENGDFYYNYTGWTYASSTNYWSPTYSLTWNELNATTHDGYIRFYGSVGHEPYWIKQSLTQSINVTDVDMIYVKGKSGLHYEQSGSFKVTVGSLVSARFPTNISWNVQCLNVSSLSGMQSLKIEHTLNSHLDYYYSQYYVDWVRTDEYTNGDDDDDDDTYPPSESVIWWHENSYYADEIGQIDWFIHVDDWFDTYFGYGYTFYLNYKDSSESEYNSIRLTSESGSKYITFDETDSFITATMTKHLNDMSDSILYTPSTLDTDTVNIYQRDKTGSITSNVTETTTGSDFNITYKYDYAVTSPVISIKRLVDGVWSDDTLGIISISNYVVDTEYNITHSIAQEGKYLLELRDAGTILAARVINIVFIINPPTQNITLSFIDTDKSTYQIGSRIKTDFAIDNTNYSSYAAFLEVYNNDYGILSYRIPVYSQIDNHWIRLGEDKNIDTNWGFFVIDTPKFYSGSNTIRLSGYDLTTGEYNLNIVSKNITIDIVTTSGYGLTVSDNAITVGDSVIINYIVPSASTLKIIRTSTQEIIKTMEINTSDSFSYTFEDFGIYDIELHSVNYLEVTTQIIVSDIDIVDEIEDDDVAFGTSFESMLSSGSFIALLIIIACVGAFGKIGGVVGVFLGMVVGISISFLMGYLPAWILFIMVLALCVVFVSKLINSFGGGE